MNEKVKIAWYGKHFGEEPPLVGNENQGAGGIFFTGCNLRCVFCQNYQISQENIGEEYDINELADIMIELQNDGAINIDLVTPTIWFRQIKSAIKIAKDNGLNIPIVWNSNAYENIDIIREMEGFVDIYLPDFKYSNNDIAFNYSGIKNYKETAISAIREMIKQVGLLNIDNNIAKSGVIIRHLILPNNIENSIGVLDEIARIDKDVHIGLMSQYGPIFKAGLFPEIDRKLTQNELDIVYNYQLELGIENGWYQELDSADVFVPDFRKENPFR